MLQTTRPMIICCEFLGAEIYSVALGGSHRRRPAEHCPARGLPPPAGGVGADRSAAGGRAAAGDGQGCVGALVSPPVCDG